MIHVEDEQSLARFLGEEIPGEVRAECLVRERMFHTDGNSGPLGSVALIDMLRFMGYGPKAEVVEEKPVDWREHLQDGSTRVEARFTGQWMPGVFLGFIEGGTIAVRLDDDPHVRECRQDMVRLEGSDAVAPDPESDFDPLSEPDVESYIDWPAMKDGQALWVTEDGGVQDATFHSIAAANDEDGVVAVAVVLDGEEEPTEFTPDLLAINGG